MDKKQRLKSHENLQSIREMPCEICNAYPPNDVHHIVSRGAGGGDELTNICALCRCHHVEIHKIGRKTFALKYKVQKILDVIE